MKYGLLFLTAAALLTALAVRNGRVDWIAIWAAIAFAVVGVGYLWLGPRVFGKRPDGRIPLGRILLLLPFFLYVWSVWHLLRRVRRESAYDELVPGVLIGRRLLSHELPDDVPNVIDLTSEFPEPRGIAGRSGYRCFPTLDATAPTADVVIEVIAAMDSMTGPVYIHCAEGHGRTGLVAAVLLLRRRMCGDPTDALRFVQERRSLVRLNTAQSVCLAECAARVSSAHEERPAS